MRKSHHFPVKKLAAVIGGLTLSIGATSQLHAQEESSFAIEEVIVTAQKRAENLQDTPIAISTLGEMELDRQGIQSTSDLRSAVAALQGYEPAPARGNFSPAMRGMSGGNPNSISTDPAVAIYMDGVYQGKQVGSTMDVADIQRIEVLRGPQGTLYGRNATAGAINFITKQPTGEFHTKIKVSAGSHDAWGLKVGVDLPAIGSEDSALGVLNTSIGYNTRQRDDLYGNTVAGMPGFENIDRTAFRFAANWQVSDNFTVDYVYTEAELNEHGPMNNTWGLPINSSAGTNMLDDLVAARDGGSFAGNSPWVQQSVDMTIDALRGVQQKGDSRPGKGTSDIASSVETETDSHSLTLTWDAGDMGALGEVTFKSITGLSSVENRNIGDLDGIDNSLTVNGDGDLVGVMHPLVLQTALLETSPLGGAGTEAVLQGALAKYGASFYNIDMGMEYESFSQELQMVGSTENVDYVVGLYYFEDSGENYNQTQPLAPIGNTGVVGFENATRAEAIYGQATYRFTDDFAMTAGLRYSHEKKWVEYLNQSGSYVGGWTPVIFGGNYLYAYPTAVGDGIVSPNFANGYGQKFWEGYYNVSGSLNATYNVNDDLMVYATLSTGFHSGYFNGDSYVSGTTTGEPLEEEIVTNLEIGMKSSWMDNRVQLNAALFAYEFDDIQVSQTVVRDGTLASNYVNAGKAKRHGLELDLKVAATADLMLSLSYVYMHGHFDKYPRFCALNGCINNMESFAQRARTPDNAIRFAADYTIAQTDFAEYTARLSVDWQEEAGETAVWAYAIDGGDTPHVYDQGMNDERTIVGARLAMENIQVGNGTMSIALSGKNLTDDDYMTMGINYGPSLGIYNQNYGEPRTWMLDVTYEY